MRKAGYLALIVVLAGVGAYLAMSRGQTGGEWWFEGHFKVVQGQLASLKHHLQLYKEAHGRYPTNDEGLAALDNYEARFVVDSYEPAQIVREFYGHSWQMGARTIPMYREDTGHVPRNAEEFAEALNYYSFDKPPKSAARAAPAELAIGVDDQFFVLSEAGVETPWMVPYVYENREGLGEEKFAGSPAERDRTGRWSVKVDEGVYVHSVGAQLLAERFDREWWEENGPRFAGGGLIVAAIILLVVMVWTSKMGVKTGLAALVVSAGAGAVIGSAGVAMCYAMSLPFSRRDPEMVREQRELLGKYHERGVITDATYEKAMEGLREKDEP